MSVHSAKLSLDLKIFGKNRLPRAKLNSRAMSDHLLSKQYVLLSLYPHGRHFKWFSTHWKLVW